ncbi:MAG TPA: leucyl aminopeptidase [Thermoplasmata archaeon]|nr:leucyl aminopeptidase [Thermoplasmata archaeon]
MKIGVEVGDIARWEDEVVVVNLFEGVNHPGGATGAVDAAIGHQITAMIATGDITGKFKEIVVFPTFDRIPGNRVLVVGLGERADFTLDRVREVSAAAAIKIRDMGLRTFATVVHGAGVGHLDLGDATEAVVEGTLLGLYRYTEHKTDNDHKKIESVTLVNLDKARAAAMREAVHRASIIATTTNFARDLVNAPSNAKPPRLFADRIRDAAKEAGARLTVFDEKQLEKMGFGCLLGVAKGSVEPPRFLVLSHDGGGKSKPVVLVGKGITFDAGGIALKPLEAPGSDPMWLMRYDMGGAAAALSAVLAAARLKLPVNAVALAPLTENMPSGSAQKPGDIVRAFGGRTIEVLNPDAEGRLVLADALGYAKTLKPQAVVDLATLTGAVKVALGRHAAGMFSNREELAKRLERAAEATSERVWRLPLWDEYSEQIKSDSADVKNTGGRSAGTITAAKFLEKFADDVSWAHLDIAGTAWVEDSPDSPKKSYLPKGASGYGVRLLIRLLRDWQSVE